MRSSRLGRSACAGPMTTRPPGSCSRLRPGSPALPSSRSGSAHSNTVICQPDPSDGQGWTQRYRTHTKRDNLHQATDPSGRRAKAEIFGVRLASVEKETGLRSLSVTDAVTGLRELSG